MVGRQLIELAKMPLQRCGENFERCRWEFQELREAVVSEPAANLWMMQQPPPPLKIIPIAAFNHFEPLAGNIYPSKQIR